MQRKATKSEAQNALATLLSQLATSSGGIQ
jgi:hypothetical protein